MKKVLLTVTLCIIIFTAYPLCAFEVKPLALPRFEILMPGKTRTITIEQQLNYPQDFNQILIMAIGYGGVSISIAKEEGDTVDNMLVLTGIGISPAGIIPFYKFGRTGLILDASIEIGNEGFPFGIIWVSSWINPPLPEPPDNQYMLILSSFLTF
jgi:hypothetical protein